MSKSRPLKKEKISVASEIDRTEERKLHCKQPGEGRKEQLYANILPHNLIHNPGKRVFLCTYRPALEDEMTILNERIQKYEKELQVLRGENRKNMMLSVALLAISALFYYTFIY